MIMKFSCQVLHSSEFYLYSCGSGIEHIYRKCILCWFRQLVQDWSYELKLTFYRIQYINGWWCVQVICLLFLLKVTFPRDRFWILWLSASIGFRWSASFAPLDGVELSLPHSFMKTKLIVNKHWNVWFILSLIIYFIYFTNLFIGVFILFLYYYWLFCALFFVKFASEGTWLLDWPWRWKMSRLFSNALILKLILFSLSAIHI